MAVASKATGAECLAGQMQLARAEQRSNVKQTVHDLTAVREELASLVLNSGTVPGELQAKQMALSQKERKLSRKTGTANKSGKLRRNGDVGGRDKALRPGSALIEIYRFPVLTSMPGGLFCPRRSITWLGLYRRSAGKVQMVDLGDAEEQSTRRNRQEPAGGHFFARNHR